MTLCDATRATWNSLEIVKLVASLLTPAALAVLGIFIGRVSRRYEDRRWVNQKVVEKRLAVYDDLAPALNDVLCYFTFIGCWKDLDPPAVIKLKRELDRKIHLAKPLFPAEFFEACQAFLHECFTRFGGPWGSDSQIRSTTVGRIEAHPRPWAPSWTKDFSDQHADPDKVQELYKAVMAEFTASFGKLDFTPSEYLSRLPQEVRKDALR